MVINQHFPEIHGKFGFGCMRLPMQDPDTIDIGQMKMMVDEFLEAGFNYFDTAHPYHNKKSEPAVREALTSRYPRERFLLADKMSSSFFDSEESVREQFMRQLEICGVEYFDFFLMHALSAGNYEKYKRCNVYKVLLQLKTEGRIRHLATYDQGDSRSRRLVGFRRERLPDSKGRPSRQFLSRRHRRACRLRQGPQRCRDGLAFTALTKEDISALTDSVQFQEPLQGCRDVPVMGPLLFVGDTACGPVIDLLYLKETCIQQVVIYRGTLEVKAADRLETVLAVVCQPS